MKDTLYLTRVGDLVVEAHTEDDDDPDLSWLGEAAATPDNPRRRTSNFDPFTPDPCYVYHRGERVVLAPKSELWRDARGRIVAEPEPPSVYAREYGYIRVPDNGQGCKGAIEDARRLDAYYAGEWYMVGIVATVTLRGRKIGDASCWGYESDSGEPFFRQQARQLAQDAIADARQWLNAGKVAS